MPIQPLTKAQQAKLDKSKRYGIYGNIRLLKKIEKLEKRISKSESKGLEGIIKEVQDMNPYKVVGKPETYNDYNQGWEDACDVILSKLENK